MRAISRLCFLALFVGSAVWLGVSLIDQVGHVAAIWLPNGAILACLLCERNPRKWPPYIATGYVANVAGGMIAGYSFSLLAIFATNNAIEVLIAAAIIRRGTRETGSLIPTAALLRFIVIAVVVAPASCGLFAATYLLATKDTPWLASYSQFFLAHALGLAITAPVFLGFLRGDVRPLFTKAVRWQTVRWLCGLTAVTAGVFCQSKYPFLFFIPPIVLAATISQGFAGGILYMPLIAIGALAGTLSGHGPITLANLSSLPEKIILTQMFVLSNFLMVAYAAYVTEERKHTRLKLEAEHERLLRSERVLAESEARFRILSENSVDMILQTDGSGAVTYASPSVLEATGYRPEEFISGYARDFAHPEDTAKHKQTIAELNSKGGMVTDRIRGIHKDGRAIWFERRSRRVEVGDQVTYISNIRDISASKEAEDAMAVANVELAAMAMSDSLTGLANRRRFDEAVSQEWRRMAREGKDIALLLLDVDHFKVYNDTYGHQAGDKCLAAIAKCVGQHIKRPGDLAARYGGEELVVMLPGAGEKPAAVIAETIRRHIEALAIPHSGSASGVATVSVGVAACNPAAKTSSAAAMIRQADTMLYEAKRKGRNRVVCETALMLDQPNPANREEARVRVVESYIGKAQTHVDELNRIARIAAGIMRTPVALVSLVGRDKQVFVGRYGMDARETPRNESFCAHAMGGNAPMVVGDATLDPRFKTFDCVKAEDGIRFYIGAPLIASQDGDRLGALCVADSVARPECDPEQRNMLAELADLAVRCMEGR